MTKVSQLSEVMPFISSHCPNITTTYAPTYKDKLAKWYANLGGKLHAQTKEQGWTNPNPNSTHGITLHTIWQCTIKEWEELTCEVRTMGGGLGFGICKEFCMPNTFPPICGPHIPCPTHFPGGDKGLDQCDHIQMLSPCAQGMPCGLVAAPHEARLAEGVAQPHQAGCRLHL